MCHNMKLHHLRSHPDYLKPSVVQLFVPSLESKRLLPSVSPFPRCSSEAGSSCPGSPDRLPGAQGLSAAGLREPRSHQAPGRPKGGGRTCSPELRPAQQARSLPSGRRCSARRLPPRSHGERGRRRREHGGGRSRLGGQAGVRPPNGLTRLPTLFTMAAARRWGGRSAGRRLAVSG